MGSSGSGGRRRRWEATFVGAALVASILPLALAPSVSAAATRLAFSNVSTATPAAGAQFTATVIATTDGTTVSTDFGGTPSLTLTVADAAATIAHGTPFTDGTYVFTVTLTKAGSQTLTATATGLQQATTTVTVVPALAWKLGFVTQPASSVNGTVFPTQPQVAVQDQYGNTVTSDTTTGVTLALAAGYPETNYGSGTLSGCTLASVSAGVRSFSGCKITGYGHGFALTASASGLSSATSRLFDVSSFMAWETQPGGGAGASGKAQGGIAFSSQPKVTILWPPNATTFTTSTRSLSDNTTVVTLSILAGTGTSGAKLTCDQTNSISGVTSMTVVAGSAQFSACRIDKAGSSYRLVATSSPSFPTIYSNAFDVVAGPASQLTFLAEPASGNAGQAFATQPIVAITDAGGNVVTSGVSTTVLLTIGTNTGNPAGVLTCVPSTVMSTALSGTNAGKAVFSGCSISSPGPYYTLVATAVNTQCYTSGCTKPTLASGYTKTFAVGVRGAEITVTPSSKVITWRGAVTLTTRFAVNGAGKTFELQATRDLLIWSKIATLTADSLGVASFTYTPATNLWYRAVYAPTTTTDLTAGTSPITRVVVRQIALLRPHNSFMKTVGLGTTVTFATTVRPIGPTLARAKVTYYIYRKTLGVWRLFTTRNYYIDAFGIARMPWKFAARGDWYIRSMAQPTKLNANSVMTQREFYRVP